jgi:hypothetical protein
MSKFSPSHYQQGSIQVWDFIVDQKLAYLEGNIVKYICRAGAKEGESRLDDLLKVQAYINKAISTEQANDNTPRPDGSSDQVQDSNVTTDCYNEYFNTYTSTLFDR